MSADIIDIIADAINPTKSQMTSQAQDILTALRSAGYAIVDKNEWALLRDGIGIRPNALPDSGVEPFAPTPDTRPYTGRYGRRYTL